MKCQTAGRAARCRRSGAGGAPLSRVSRITGLAVASAVAVGACSVEPSGQRVLAEDGTFIVHLPNSYTVFPSDESAPALLPGAGVLNEDAQVAAFDASAEPDIGRVAQIVSDTPIGWVISRPISNPDVQDQISWEMLRNFSIPYETIDGSQPLLEQPVSLEDPDLSGYRAVVLVPASSSPSGPNVVIDSTIYTNEAHTMLWELFVSCTEVCYLEDHFDEIQEIVGTWVVDEP